MLKHMGNYVDHGTSQVWC